MNIVLRYVGVNAYLPSIPACDITAEMLAKLVEWGWAKDASSLVETGLYVAVNDNAPAPPAIDAPASAPTRARGKAKE